MLLIIGIVGTTVAPWQLFFQQSYVVDKRITPRFIRYEKIDLWIGIVDRHGGRGRADGRSPPRAFADTPEFGNFTDAGGIAAGLAACGPVAGVLFALALIDASIIGASAVSLSTAYAIGDVLAGRATRCTASRRTQGLLPDLCRLIALAAAWCSFRARRWG